MKKFFIKKTIALFICLTAAAICFADPVEGFWLSVDDRTNQITAGWQIYQEGGRLYGKILSVSTEPRGVLAGRCRDSYPGFPVSGRVSAMPVAGTPWIFGLTRDREGVWSGGNVINPEDGNFYRCRIIHHPADDRRYNVETLEMRGEIGLGIGRSQFWRRADEATAANLWPN
jgi:uncharacterized protein (DUF2147 family)